MKKLIFSMHVSLDGYVAGPNGEMDWISLPDGLFDYVGKLTDQADTAMYGRKTFEMMDEYWPAAGERPDASKHDKQHSAWYNKVKKYILSNSMQGKGTDDKIFINGNLTEKVNKIKQQGGGDIVIFGSPSAVHSLLELSLIDEFYLMVNPVLLGKGIPVFPALKERKDFKLVSSKQFNDVVALQYAKT
jgi:dihydrofolate reductase